MPPPPTWMVSRSGHIGAVPDQIKESRPKTTIQGKKMDLIEIRAAQKAPFCCKDIMRPAALELII